MIAGLVAAQSMRVVFVAGVLVLAGLAIVVRRVMADSGRLEPGAPVDEYSGGGLLVFRSAFVLSLSPRPTSLVFMHSAGLLRQRCARQLRLARRRLSAHPGRVSV
jgi:hypothetical protein